mgnify:FL=1
MTESIRISSVAILLTLAFFCLQSGFFLTFGHGFKDNRRRSLALIEFSTGLLLCFDALAYIFRGNQSVTGYYMVRMSNYLVFSLNYASAFFFCFHATEFIKSSFLEFKILRSPRQSIKNGIPSQLFVVLFLCLAGATLTLVNQWTNFFYYFDETNLYHRGSLYPLSVALGLSPGLISVAMIVQNKKALRQNVLTSLLVYCLFPLVGLVMALFVYGVSWINIGFGLGALHLFYCSIKLMEIEFYSKNSASHLKPDFKSKEELAIPNLKKRIAKSHLWQTICVVSAGILSIAIILSITGITVPKKTIYITEPIYKNDRSMPVCVTFVRNPEKQWRDGNNYSRIGAQYDGMIYNNTKASLVTNWSFSISVPEGCSMDPEPWNGHFTLTESALKVRSLQAGDEENIHGNDYYKIYAGKYLGFGCIMYSPGKFKPEKAQITFSYESLVKPFSNIMFVISTIMLAALFVVSATFCFTEGRLIRIEEENRKLENTVKERTKELSEEKERSEALLLNILPAQIAKRLAADKESKIADRIENASVLFADIIGFTKITSALDAGAIVGALNSLYSRVDERAKREGIEKIKTIGDSYMAASGLFGAEDAGKNALALINFARGMLEDIQDFNKTSQTKFSMRIGINSGSLIAGVIGKTKFIYDIWGDTVNVASRMESSGQASKIHIAEQTFKLTQNVLDYSEPVEMEIKGKGVMKTYFLE